MAVSQVQPASHTYPGHTSWPPVSALRDCPGLHLIHPLLSASLGRLSTCQRPASQHCFSARVSLAGLRDPAGRSWGCSWAPARPGPLLTRVWVCPGILGLSLGPRPRRSFWALGLRGGLVTASAVAAAWAVAVLGSSWRLQR